MDTACKVAARARHALGIEPPSGGVALSDLLLVDGGTLLTPRRVDGAVPVSGRPGLEVQPGDSVSLYWEVYGISAAQFDRDRLRVEVDATDLREGKVAVARLAGVQDAANRLAPDARISYAASVPPGDGALGFGVTLRMGDVSGTILRVRVRVIDGTTKASAVGTRTFYVKRTAN